MNNEQLADMVFKIFAVLCLLSNHTDQSSFHFALKSFDRLNITKLVPLIEHINGGWVLSNLFCVVFCVNIHSTQFNYVFVTCSLFFRAENAIERDSCQNVNCGHCTISMATKWSNVQNAMRNAEEEKLLLFSNKIIKLER